MSEDPNSGRILRSKISLVLLFIIILSDAKLDLVSLNIKNAVSGHYSLTEKEMIRREIPMTALWEKIEPNDTENVEYIISDWYSSSYYLPRGVRLHSAIQSFGAEFLPNCNTQEDLSRLKSYRYSLLYFEKSNLCYKFVKDHGKLIAELRGIKLYQNH